MPRRRSPFIVFAAMFILWAIPQAALANCEVIELHNPFGNNWHVEFYGMVLDSDVQAEHEKRVQKEVKDCWDYVWGFLGDRYELQGSSPIFQRADPGAPMDRTAFDQFRGQQSLYSPAPPGLEALFGEYLHEFDTSDLTEQDLVVPEKGMMDPPDQEPVKPDTSLGSQGAQTF